MALFHDGGLHGGVWRVKGKNADTAKILRFSAISRKAPFSPKSGVWRGWRQVRGDVRGSWGLESADRRQRKDGKRVADFFAPTVVSGRMEKGRRTFLRRKQISPAYCPSFRCFPRFGAGRGAKTEKGRLGNSPAAQALLQSGKKEKGWQRPSPSTGLSTASTCRPLRSEPPGSRSRSVPADPARRAPRPCGSAGP